MNTAQKEDWELVDITEKDIKDAQEFPSNFGLSSSHVHCEEIYDKTWSLGPIFRNRDSDLLQESNADALIAYLKEYPDIEDDWMITCCSHWGHGWVEHMSFRIFDTDGKEPSKAFKVIKSFFDALEDYPIFDDEDFSKREYEATLTNIEDAAGRIHNREMIDNPPEDWVSQCFSWFWDNDQGAVESQDGNGGYPNDKQIITCLDALNFLKPEEKEEE